MTMHLPHVSVPGPRTAHFTYIVCIAILDLTSRRSTGTQRNGVFVPLEPVEWCDLASS